MRKAPEARHVNHEQMTQQSTLWMSGDASPFGNSKDVDSDLLDLDKAKEELLQMLKSTTPASVFGEEEEQSGDRQLEEEDGGRLWNARGNQ